MLLYYSNFPSLLKQTKISLNSLKPLRQVFPVIFRFTNPMNTLQSNPTETFCRYAQYTPLFFLTILTPLASALLHSPGILTLPNYCFSHVLFVVSKWRYSFTSTKYYSTDSILFTDEHTFPLCSAGPTLISTSPNLSSFQGSILQWSFYSSLEIFIIFPSFVLP